MAEVDPKKLKAAIKEGGKKGVELAGCADLGGLEFFTTAMDAAEGNLELLQACMDAANKEIDPTDEESKGGSGGVGKMLLSAGNDALALMCYVPADKKDKVNAKEWMEGCLAVLEKGPFEIVKADELNASALVKLNKEANRYPLKDKDSCQASSVNWLKSKGLFPQAEEEEDDWVPDDDQGIEW